MVISNESQKVVGATAGILGSNPTSTRYESAMFSRGNDLYPKGNESTMFIKKGQQNNEFQKNYTLYCEICKIRGHKRENFWKVVGYSADFMFRKRVGTSGNTTCNAEIENTEHVQTIHSALPQDANTTTIVNSMLGGAVHQSSPCIFTN